MYRVEFTIGTYNMLVVSRLRNGVKYCKLLKLPEVLCIHLKRFRHEYLMSYSSKISSAVSFPSTVNNPHTSLTFTQSTSNSFGDFLNFLCKYG